MGFIFIILFCSFLVNTNAGNFNTYYYPLWGGDHVRIDPNEVTLKLDKDYGAGFRSKYQYGSGKFHIKMKLPDRRTEGVVTSFYLTSAPDNQPLGNHFELDFEFLGTNGTLQTNVYVNEVNSHREQSFKLWFNPSQDFHTYEILWNSHQIVFYIDTIPIRVFKNNMGKGIPYPNRPMQVEASIWNANWAGVVDWANAPFIAHYQDFDFLGCWAHGNAACDAYKYKWNREKYWDLNANDKNRMKVYRKLYMTYDYCWNPATAKPECALNN